MHTCVLEYGSDHVTVTDIIHEKLGSDWTHKIGSYRKVRISVKLIEEIIKNSGMTIVKHDNFKGQVVIIAKKDSVKSSEKDTILPGSATGYIQIDSIMNSPILQMRTKKSKKVWKFRQLY